jgi:glycosyltransferase involved in cell wall biosynthesis
MKIAFILPSLSNKGPIIVAKDIIENINKEHEIDLYYFDEINEISINCNLIRISIFDKIDFDKYEVVHSHMLRPDFYVWFHKKNHKKTLFISTLHQNIYFVLKEKFTSIGAILIEKIWLFFLKKQDVVVMLSNVMSLYYSKKTMLNNTIIHNGRSISYNEINDGKDITLIKQLNNKYKTIVSHSGITKGKGLHQIINSLVSLKDYAFIVIGNGLELENLKRLASDLEVRDRCFFMGYKKDAIAYLKYFDLYVMSSYSEGFPLALLEAGLNKKPIVCSDISIFRELFTQNEVCFFELDNIYSLSMAIEKCYSNKEELSNTIFETINEKYSVSKMAENYLELYKNSF